MLDVKTMKGSCVTPKMAGIESNCKLTERQNMHTQQSDYPCPVLLRSRRVPTAPPLGASMLGKSWRACYSVRLLLPRAGVPSRPCSWCHPALGKGEAGLLLTAKKTSVSSTTASVRRSGVACTSGERAGSREDVPAAGRPAHPCTNKGSPKGDALLSTILVQGLPGGTTLAVHKSCAGCALSAKDSLGFCTTQGLCLRAQRGVAASDLANGALCDKEVVSIVVVCNQRTGPEAEGESKHEGSPQARDLTLLASPTLPLSLLFYPTPLVPKQALKEAARGSQPFRGTSRASCARAKCWEGSSERSAAHERFPHTRDRNEFAAEGDDGILRKILLVLIVVGQELQAQHSTAHAAIQQHPVSLTSSSGSDRMEGILECTLPVRKAVPSE